MKVKVSSMTRNQQILDGIIENLDSDNPAIEKAITVSKVVNVKFRGYRDQLKYQQLEELHSMNIPFYKE